MNSPFANTMLDSLNVPNSSADQRGWARMYPTAGKDGLDLLTRLMQVATRSSPPPSPRSASHHLSSPRISRSLPLRAQFDPRNRLSAQEGLKHPYCAQFHDPGPPPRVELLGLLSRSASLASGRSSHRVQTAADSEHVANKSVEIPYDDNKKRSTADYRDKLCAPPPAELLLAASHTTSARRSFTGTLRSRMRRGRSRRDDGWWRASCARACVCVCVCVWTSPHAERARTLGPASRPPGPPRLDREGHGGVARPSPPVLHTSAVLCSPRVAPLPGVRPWRGVL
jgi:hypothetical protein